MGHNVRNKRMGPNLGDKEAHCEGHSQPSLPEESHSLESFGTELGAEWIKDEVRPSLFFSFFFPFMWPFNESKTHTPMCVGSVGLHR